MPATLEKPVEERQPPGCKKLLSKGVFVEYCQMPAGASLALQWMLNAAKYFQNIGIFSQAEYDTFKSSGSFDTKFLEGMK